MEDPVSEIPTVIQRLTQSPPGQQSQTIDAFFTPDASFVHPFCRIQRFRGSRWVVKKIYQWYKVMSPRIEMKIHSIAYDSENLKLYVTMSQIFTIWIIPFHVAPVTLTTVLSLTTNPNGSLSSPSATPSAEKSNEPEKEGGAGRGGAGRGGAGGGGAGGEGGASYADVVANGTPDSKTPRTAQTNGQRKLYYITKQEDLYQTSEFVKFVLPHIGNWIVLAIHAFATVFCVLGVFLWWPFVWMEEKGWIPGLVLKGGNIIYDIRREKVAIRSGSDSS
ncbi:hypothetical protein BDV26DRAFT_253742 [Aspergillus bertholletiae]|uniref:SigF-like NTF2-like domain-containing protein n=1 Tax=Aspergillus bertholletiae TaxID=1226010 RepID=A0A5N7BKL9_9EURO|nr:hypothetical protein BDV26DRAFT_253742 [Aspergillus bertholletiae]